MAKKTITKTTAADSSAETGAYIQFPGSSTSALNYYANHPKEREAAAARFDALIISARQASKAGKKAQRARSSQ